MAALARALDPSLHRLTGLFGELELDWAARLLLPDRRALLHRPRQRHVGYRELHDIAAAQLAVDGEVEQREIPLATSICSLVLIDQT